MQTPQPDEPQIPGGAHQCLEWCPICRGAEMLKSAVPPELQEQFQVVQRDALLLAQAVIEAQLERMRAQQAGGDSTTDYGPDKADRGNTEDGPGVESIPIE